MLKAKLSLCLPDTFDVNNRVKVFHYTNYILITQCFKM